MDKPTRKRDLPTLRACNDADYCATGCEALLAFAGGDYAVCVEWLRPVHRVTHRCGGSLAQCDIIHLTFTEAALRARKPRLAGALVAERVAQKPTSRLNARLQARLRTIEPAAA